MTDMVCGRCGGVHPCECERDSEAERRRGLDSTAPVFLPGHVAVPAEAVEDVRKLCAVVERGAREHTRMMTRIHDDALGAEIAARVLAALKGVE